MPVRIGATLHITGIDGLLIGSELVRVQQIQFVRRILNGIVGIELNGQFALPTFFGGHQDHSVGTPGTIDRGCGSIFQDLYGFDIVGLGKDRPHKTVDHYQWRTTGIDRGVAPDLNIDRGTGLPTVVGLYHHTGGTSLYRLRRIEHRESVQFLRFYRGYRTGNVALLSGAVTDHHHFVQLSGVFREDHVYSRLSRNGSGNSGKTK